MSEESLLVNLLGTADADLTGCELLKGSELENGSVLCNKRGWDGPISWLVAFINRLAQICPPVVEVDILEKLSSIRIPKPHINIRTIHNTC